MIGRTVELKAAEVSDHVAFGTCEQDKNFENGAEGIGQLE